MIYTRIDTYSVILYNCSIKSILANLFIPTANLKEVYKNAYAKHDVKIGDTFVWLSQGVRLECKLDEYKDKEEATDIFDIDFSWIRLYLSGQGMDYIYSLTSDIDNYDFSIALCNPEFWSSVTENFKITRCDFAFDYINYEGNEFERLRKIIACADFDDKLSDKGRLYTGGMGSLTYSYRGGKERTIYLGSSAADRMLRIYDKKYQVTDEFGNIDTSQIPKAILDHEVSVDSWHRVELQTRDNFAARYLFSCNGNFRYIMGEIASYFDVRTKDGKKIAPLHKIFLWTERTPIIQNANSAQPKKEIEIVTSWVGSISLQSLQIVVGVIGWEGLRRILNESVKNHIQQPFAKRHLYINKLNNRLKVICEQEHIKFDVNGNIGDLVKLEDGGFYFGPFPSVSPPTGPYVSGGNVI